MSETYVDRAEWIIPDAMPVPADLAEAVGGHPLVAQLLMRAGICTVAEAERFLDPEKYTPAPAEDLPDMQKAAERIERAIAAAQPIAVWGDFDVDGQTSTTLLVSALRDLGAEVRYHIPVRREEGHGVNIAHLQPLIEAGAQLIVTCDTGSDAQAALQFAADAGIDVIVTDHHELPQTLPPCYALVNPRRLPEDHPLSGLPGVGVAYKLAECLYMRAGRPKAAAALLDLTALGIVADVAPLQADTRHLLQRGLHALRNTPRIGLQAMFRAAGIPAAHLSEEHIGFGLAPRLNALGRLEDAAPAVDLFTTEDVIHAEELAGHLEGLNTRRRMLTRNVLNAAHSLIQADPRVLDHPALVLAYEGWQAGVVGIVANHLVEEYGRPVILLVLPGEDNGYAHGSARSIPGVNIHAAITACADLLHSSGGHTMAAGLSLLPENIDEFRRKLGRAVVEQTGGALPIPTLTLAGEVHLKDLSQSFVADLERLSPFGNGNPAPILLIRDLHIQNSVTLGRTGEHRQVLVEDGSGNTAHVLWWGGADEPQPEGRFDLACTVRAENFRGQTTVQLEWVDWRAVPESAPPSIEYQVCDERAQAHPLPALERYVQEGSCLVWGEGVRAASLKVALPRTALTPADTLLVWTVPPDDATLQDVLRSVSPRRVVLFASLPAEDDADTFLKCLRKLVNIAQQRAQPVSLNKLAAATAQSLEVVRFALRWLEQSAYCRLDWPANRDEVLFLPPNMQSTPTSAEVSATIAAALENDLRTLLMEAQQFRQYYQDALQAGNLLKY